MFHSIIPLVTMFLMPLVNYLNSKFSSDYRQFSFLKPIQTNIGFNPNNSVPPNIEKLRRQTKKFSSNMNTLRTSFSKFLSTPLHLRTTVFIKVAIKLLSVLYEYDPVEAILNTYTS